MGFIDPGINLQAESSSSIYLIHHHSHTFIQAGIQCLQASLCELQYPLLACWASFLFCPHPQFFSVSQSIL